MHASHDITLDILDENGELHFNIGVMIAPGFAVHLPILKSHVETMAPRPSARRDMCDGYIMYAMYANRVCTVFLCAFFSRGPIIDGEKKINAGKSGNSTR